jgi:hypothetical protein
MSSSQLLTITESHGFRALLAAVVWIIGRFARIGHGLRTLSCGNRQTARMDDSSGSWLRILISNVASARREPVLWFDITGRRDGPVDYDRRHQYVLLYGSPHYSLAPAYAKQAAPARE